MMICSIVSRPPLHSVPILSSSFPPLSFSLFHCYGVAYRNEQFDHSTWKTKLIFVTSQLLYTIVCMLPVAVSVACSACAEQALSWQHRLLFFTSVCSVLCALLLTDQCHRKHSPVKLPDLVCLFAHLFVLSFISSSCSASMKCTPCSSCLLGQS